MAARAAPPTLTAPMVPRLEALAIRTLCEDWRPSRSLANLPAELAKLIYAELKARAARALSSA